MAESSDVWSSFNDAVTAKGTEQAPAGQVDNDGTTIDDLNLEGEEVAPEETEEEAPEQIVMETPHPVTGAGTNGKLPGLLEDEEFEGSTLTPKNVDQYKMSGFLEKKGHMIANWRNRFFTFDPNTKEVKYFEKSADQPPKGKLTVTSVLDIPDRNESGVRQNRFDLVGYSSAKGELLLAVAAKDKATKAEWLEKLNGVLNVKVKSRASKKSFLGALDTLGETLSRRSSARSMLMDGRAWRAVKVEVLRATNMPATSGSFRCTLVPLDSRGDEMILEKQRTAASDLKGGTVTWQGQQFVFGICENMAMASSILIKLKESSGTDYGSIHLQLDPIFGDSAEVGADAAGAKKGGDATAATTAKADAAKPKQAVVMSYGLESRRKSVGGVSGSVQLSVVELVEPAKDVLEEACKALMAELTIEDRAVFMKMHPKCFVGSDAVEKYRTGSLPAPLAAVAGTGEDAALFYLNAMVRQQLIVCVPRRGPQFERFENKFSFYRFAAHEEEMGGSSSSSYAPGRNDIERVTVADFQVIKLLGTGAFGKVVMAKHRGTGKIVAIKVLEKSGMSEADKANTWAERTVLNQLHHPFVATLEFAFQTRGKLFIGMEYFAGGDLHHHMHRRAKGKALGEPRCQFYASEVVAALAHLHALKIVYRDLKGENVMIASDGHIRLVDFGLAALQVARNTCTSLVGSPFYVAPEVLRNFKTKTGYGKAVDWWSTGVLIYEMLVGRTPFETDSSNRQRLYKNICSMPLRLPAYLHRHAKDLLKGLLTRDPSKRMGVQGNIPKDIMEHPYWGENMDWEALQAKKVAPPWVPDQGQEYVDKEFLRQKAPLLGTASDARDLYSSKGGEFEGFTVKKN